MMEDNFRPTYDQTTIVVSRSLSGNGSSSSSGIPINEPVIRTWELNENSTHYDRMVAAPSDEDMIKFWIGWASIMLISGVLTTMILIPLLSRSRPKIRKNPFNVYLICLMIPDCLVSWTCGFTCLTNAMAGQFTSAFMCYFQSFYMIFAIGANSWLNLLITRQLYKMLEAAKKFQRYPFPQTNQVIKESICVYAYSIVLATIGILPHVDWWPHRTRLTIGAACIPMDYSYASTAFFYGIFFPLLFGIPLAYVCWAAFQIYNRNMLPPSGRRRILAVYFFRLAAVFVIMWLPGLLLLFVLSAWIPPWVQWAGGSWSHLQALVSAMLSLLKADIWKAVRDFWLCVPAGAPAGMVPSSSNNHHRRAAPSDSIVTKKDWANSSVYWSSQIGLVTRPGKKESIQSRVSSYREADDDLEAAGQQQNFTLETRSNVLASDDSVSLERDGMELPEESADYAMALPTVSRVELPPNDLPTVDEEVESRCVSSSGRRSIPPSHPNSSHERRHDDKTDAPVGTIYIVPKI